MRAFGLGPLELLICCVPLFVVLTIVFVLSAQRSGSYGSQRPMPPAQPQMTLPVAGWYSDPLGNHELRYWDGWKWTEHVSDSGVQKIDPL